MTASIRVEESVQIARSASEVREAIADYSFDRLWRQGLREMTPELPGPPALGTKVHDVIWSSGRDYVADTVVIDLDPGVSYRFAGTGTLGGVGGGRAVRAEGAGAVFTYTVALQPQGAMRLPGPILGRFVRSGLKNDLRRLKTLLERQGGS